MTSSLVGSEMCIRDSLSAVPPSYERQHTVQEGLRRVVGLVEDGSAALQPVSYTHLTLPTICSV
eukprot:5869699-Prorocentrum_lima.AAC.1